MADDYECPNPPLIVTLDKDGSSSTALTHFPAVPCPKEGEKGYDEDCVDGPALCLNVTAADAEDNGGTVGGCTTESTPDETYGAETETDEDETGANDSPVGDYCPTPEELQDCTGGGQYVWKKNKKWTLERSYATDKPGWGTGSYTKAECLTKILDAARDEMRKEFEKLFVAGGGSCTKVDCAEDCEMVSSWSRKLWFTYKVLESKLYNTGSSTEKWWFKVNVWVKADITLNVACVCPDA